MTWRGSTTVPHRIFSCLPYLLPLFHSLIFSSSFFHVFPVVGNVISPLVAPIVVVYNTIPLANLVVFLVLFLLVVRNEKVHHFIRFNTMQALLIDFILLVITLILPFLGQIVNFGILGTALSSTIFLCVLAMFIYSIVQSLRGVYAEIPTISEAVYSQVQ
jgi:uncharacterized membrane protein